MFKFFTQKKWQLWSWLGSFVILSSLWVQVKIDVKINEWFGNSTSLRDLGTLCQIHKFSMLKIAFVDTESVELNR